MTNEVDPTMHTNAQYERQTTGATNPGDQRLPDESAHARPRRGRKSMTVAIVCAAAMALFAASCGGGDKTAAYCDKLQEYDDQNLFDEARFLEDDYFDKLATATNEMADIAPDEISDHFETLRANISETSEILSSVDGDIMAAMSDPELMARLETLGTDPAVDTASDAVDEFNLRECNIDTSG